MINIFRQGLWILLALSVKSAWTQSSAVVTESKQEILTYPFSDPNPVPVLSSNPKIYPYHTFDGYAHDAEPKEWTVVTLENDYVVVYVLPEIGGKVWGAVDKVNGKEFIYRNEVVKFRNIAMRGPWTSGGIEFNFGIIGHHPSTATPVDYTTRKNADGSVSCIVGNIDLPSQTKWRVEIRLPSDRAYFETRVLFANESEVPQAYYNWMTAAAIAKEDLHFFTPGNQYLEHGGANHSWPMDSALGRDLSKYQENAFGGSKSYHVVGAHDDFFGGYYQTDGYGFGHWAEYEEMPGQKLWLWALSRQGGIWEDLLTDDDGQYIEFQAGRMLDQYSLNAAANPITKSQFEPGRTDIWREFWFPVPSIGGVSEVSKGGILHVESSEAGSQVSVSSFGKKTGPIFIRSKSGDTLVHVEVSWLPLEPEEFVVDLSPDDIIVEVPSLQLLYDPSVSKEINRPFAMDSSLQVQVGESLDYRSRMADQQFRDRNFVEAREMHSVVLAEDPVHVGSRLGLARIAYRNGEFDAAWEHIRVVLQVNTYHEEANYWAGVIHRAQGDVMNALESFGWGARSAGLRAECYAQMAELYLAQGDLDAARKYGNNALDFNRFHLGARTTLTLVASASGDQREQARQISMLLSLDPLNHFANYEKYKLTNDPKDLESFQKGHRSEFAYQTYLDLAIQYAERGAQERAVEILALAPNHPLVSLWYAWMIRDQDPAGSQVLLQQVASSHADYVFPYRLQSGPVLLWALNQSNHWKLSYYRALQLWSWNRQEEARSLMSSVVEKATTPTFFMSLAALRSKEDSLQIRQDLERAYQLDTGQWRVLHELQKYAGKDRLRLARCGYQKHPGNDALTFDLVEALLAERQSAEAIDVLAKAQILPFEGAGKGHELWVTAHLQEGLIALQKGQFDRSRKAIQEARRWPENLGVGRPYQPDESLITLAQMAIERAQGFDLSNSSSALVNNPDGRVLSERGQAMALVACKADPNCSWDRLMQHHPTIPKQYAKIFQEKDLRGEGLLDFLAKQNLSTTDLYRSIVQALLP